MKKICCLFALLVSAWMNAGNDYRYLVDLNKVNNDKVTVTLFPPDLSGNEIDFMFPAMVPGTYEVYDFGRFISNFSATGKNGVVIKITKVNVNTYRLSPANAIEKITYSVDDTFDKCDQPGTKEKIIFEPGGTNFEEGKNFSINTHSMFGYFKGMTARNFVLEFEKPKGFYPATGLSDIKIGNDKDVITVYDYHALVDSPIMYTLPDTATVKVANTSVLVANYSPNKQISAHFIAETLRQLLYKQRDYLGGDLPVNKYAFLFYFTDKRTQSGSHGALEHSYSSFYVMPEYDSLAIEQQLRDVAAHEFFHIVTPLTIHSHEIGEFDFNDPKMSEHLWLYEGMTEYAAHHAQVKGDLIDINQFLSVMMQKYETSLEAFNDTMSFTYMSKHVLEEKIHKQYNNVYEKGAVIGMCLDIMLRDKSEGKYGTQDLMKDLATKYGKDKSFSDGDLFNDIEKFTYPEIGKFLRQHVGGGVPLPMEDVLNRVGIKFVKENESFEFTIGVSDINYNETTKRLYVESTRDMDDFGKALGFKRGDEFSKLNGKELSLETARQIFGDYYRSVKEGDIVNFEVYRPKRKAGKYSVKTLSAPAKKIKIIHKNQIAMDDTLSEDQKRCFRTWLGIK